MPWSRRVPSPPRQVLRSKEQEADIQETALSTAKSFANFSPVIGELLQGAEFRKADISFERQHVVDLGGVRARVMAMGAIGADRHMAGQPRRCATAPRR